MARLFIIGNGFDRAHDLETGYNHFHEYLKKEYPDAVEPHGLLPEWEQTPDGDIIYSTEEEVGFIESVISEVEGEEWNELEKALGYLEFDEYLEDDWGEDENPFHVVYRNQDAADVIYDVMSSVTEYFEEWIDTIDLDNVMPKKDFYRLIDAEKDKFFTFNYTCTLEDVYGCQNVCHIHGEQGSELLFGHGNDKDYSEEDMRKHVGSENALLRLRRRLRKDTKGAIERNLSFFHGLGEEIKEIYSYGFSFADVDLIYIRKICESIDTNDVTWYLNDYNCTLNSPQYLKLECKLQECGFRGEVDVFHVD